MPRVVESPRGAQNRAPRAAMCSVIGPGAAGTNGRWPTSGSSCVSGSAANR